MKTQSITDLTEHEMLDFVSFAIQEAMNGNLEELDSALWIIETLRDGVDPDRQMMEEEND